MAVVTCIVLHVSHAVCYNRNIGRVTSVTQGMLQRLSHAGCMQWWKLWCFVLDIFWCGEKEKMGWDAEMSFDVFVYKYFPVFLQVKNVSRCFFYDESDILDKHDRQGTGNNVCNSADQAEVDESDQHEVALRHGWLGYRGVCPQV